MPRGMLVRLVGLGLLVLGIVAVAVSVADGAAHLALLVVFPVVCGSSALFAVGVLLAFVGFFLSLLGFAAGEGAMAQGVGTRPAEEAPARGTGPSSSTGSRGGLENDPPEPCPDQILEEGLVRGPVGMGEGRDGFPAQRVGMGTLRGVPGRGGEDSGHGGPVP